MALLSIGDTFPDFDLIAVKPGPLALIDAYDYHDYFQRVTLTPTREDQWTIIFFWPKNFSFICPTEISCFSEHYNEFDALNTRIIGISTDNEYSTFAWRKSEKSLINVPFPMASDVTRSLSRACGAMGKEGVCDRVTFILDPNCVIRQVSASSQGVGRSIDETLRQLEALQNPHLCVAEWHRGESHLSPLDYMKDY